MKTSPNLAEALERFTFDRGSPRLTFAGRLARENGWTLEHAERVLREYLRFVYLASVAGQQVTPSVAVDQAWHLHLCYTRSYWEDLCAGVLGRALHHQPTRGGEAEDERFIGQYEHTLRRYEEEFGEPPPVDLWPPARVRFSRKTQPFQVTRERHLVVEKARLHAAARVGLACGLLVVGAGASLLETVSDSGLLLFLILAGPILVLALLGWIRGRNRVRRHRGRNDGSGCGGSGCGGSGGGRDSGCGADGGDGGDGGGGGCGGGCGGGD